MAQYRRSNTSGRRSAPRRRARSNFTRSRSRVGSGRRKSAGTRAPKAQTLKIVIEQTQPSLPFPTGLPSQVGQQVAVTPKRARF